MSQVVNTAAFDSPSNDSLKRDLSRPPTSVIVAGGPMSLKDEFSLADTTSLSDDTASLISLTSEADSAPSFRFKQWDGKKHYSDFIAEGLRFLGRNTAQVIMLFEAPSTSSHDSSFYNSQVYKFHDYPPCSSSTKAYLGPCRYACMNGSTFPTFLQGGVSPTPGLMEHWSEFVPGYIEPTFVPDIPDSAMVYTYLPVESISHHVNDPHVHYHMCGKDAIPLMTNKTTKVLTNTHGLRPCVVKTTHSMGSKGIFIIRNDDDNAELDRFLVESGNPTYVITDFVDIGRNVACHFFIHPNGEVTWFGSNENFRLGDGRFSSDSYFISADQEKLREMQVPFVRDVAAYCKSLGFWGFCGVDVLFDKTGQGYLVDVNPRVTGSCPSIMVAQRLREIYGFEFGLFRRSGAIYFYGTPAELFSRVKSHNEANEGRNRIVILAALADPDHQNLTKMNIGVYGQSLEECKTVLDSFAHPKPTIA